MKIRCNNCFEQHDNSFSVCPHCGYSKGAAAAELYHLYPGMVLQNRYTIGQVLGFGGFGITYKAWDQNLDKVIAIKEYYPAGLVNRIPGAADVILFAKNRVKEFEHGMTRFLDEARMMRKFESHKNIVSVFSHFSENNTAYIVMEFLDGCNLNEFLKNDDLDFSTCMDITFAISAALRAIHAQGIIHRDVSPDNIFLCTDGSVKLIDFGAARISQAEDRQMTIILKPGFAPPEQYESNTPQGPWTDIYALGATLYYMTTGQKPEESTNRKIADNLVNPNELNPEIPEYVSNSIVKAMAVEQHMRFQSVAEFEKGLRQEKKVLPPAQEKKKRKTRRLVTVLSALLAVIIGISIAGWRYQTNVTANVVPAGAIEVWYIKPLNEADAQKKAAAMEALVANFMQGLSQQDEKPTIQLKPIPEIEYADAIAEANAVKTLPALFESTGLPQMSLSSAESVQKFFANDLNTRFAKVSDCLFSDAEYGRQIPLGFAVEPVRYVNQDLKDNTEEGSRDAFLAGKVKYFNGSSLNLMELQKGIGEQAATLTCESSSTEIKTTFVSAWSFGQGNGAQRRIARALLSSMLSENGQRTLFVSYRTPSRFILPTNRKLCNAEITKASVPEFCKGFLEGVDLSKLNPTF